MSARERLLFVSPVVPDPDGTGVERRAFQWIAQLSDEGAVHLLLAVPGGGRALPEAAAKLVAQRVEAPAGGGAGFSRVVVFRLAAHDAAAEVARELGPARFELDLDDFESETRLSLARLGLRRGWLREALGFLNSSRIFARLERERLPFYSRVYVAAGEDAAVLRARFPGLDVAVQPNRVPRVAAARRLSAVPTFLFVGTLSYLPNRDAALWIAESLAPVLRTRLAPGFRLIIAGHAAPAGLRERLGRVPEVGFLGAVEDLSPFYAGAHAALAPVRAGGGTKIKVLEAFMRRCPVVAMPHAARGLGARDGVHLIQARDAASFAEACRSLATDEPRREAIAAAAHCLAAERFAFGAPASRPAESVATERP